MTAIAYGWNQIDPSGKFDQLSHWIIQYIDGIPILIDQKDILWLILWESEGFFFFGSEVFQSYVTAKLKVVWYIDGVYTYIQTCICVVLVWQQTMQSCGFLTFKRKIFTKFSRSNISKISQGWLKICRNLLYILPYCTLIQIYNRATWI